MRLFLFRHAEAAPGVPDAGRALTDHGRRQVERMLRLFDWSCVEAVKTIEHSGLVRARQTAEILEAGLRPRKPLVIHSSIRPTDDPMLAAAELAASREDRLLVGHNPHLSLLAGTLLAGGLVATPIILKKAGFLALERTRPAGKDAPLGRWTLLWLISPGRLAPDPA